MSEVPNPTSQDQHLTTDRLTGDEVDLDGMAERREIWQQTGECSPIIEIGSIPIDPETLAAITKGLQDTTYQVTESPHEMLRGNANLSQKMAKLEGIDPIADNEARLKLGALFTEFEKIVDEDLARLGIDKTEHYYGFFASFGTYDKAADVPHIDDIDERNLRYLVTIMGPTTIFYGGQFGPEHLDTQEGNLIEAETPEDAQPQPVPLLSVIRFQSACDPHCPPEPDPEQHNGVRVFFDARVSIEDGDIPIDS